LSPPARSALRVARQTPARPIRSTLQRPVPLACPINALSVLNGTDNYRLRCYRWPGNNCALWNGMMAPRRRPPRSAGYDDPHQIAFRERLSRWAN
jgi:hypothetical protein